MKSFPTIVAFVFLPCYIKASSHPNHSLRALHENPQRQRRLKSKSTKASKKSSSSKKSSRNDCNACPTLSFHDGSPAVPTFGVPAKNAHNPSEDFIFTLSILEPACSDIEIEFRVNGEDCNLAPVSIPDQPQDSIIISQGETESSFTLNLPYDSNVFNGNYEIFYNVLDCNLVASSTFFAVMPQ